MEKIVPFSQSKNVTNKPKNKQAKKTHTGTQCLFNKHCSLLFYFSPLVLLITIKD